MIRILAAALAALLAAMAIPGTAAACSCSEPPPEERDLARYDALFRGVVVEVIPPPRTTLREVSLQAILGEATVAEMGAAAGHVLRRLRDRHTAVFAVEHVWKGPRQARLTVSVHGIDSPSCGYEFEEGWRGVVTASRDIDGALTTGLCTMYFGARALHAVYGERPEEHGDAFLTAHGDRGGDPTKGARAWGAWAPAGLALAGALVALLLWAVPLGRRRGLEVGLRSIPFPLQDARPRRRRRARGDAA